MPTLPPSGAAISVWWSGGKSYAFTLQLSDDIHGNLYYETEERYLREYQKEYLDFFQRDLITVTKTEKLEDNKAATYYATGTGDFVKIRYALSVGDKTVAVDKQFFLRLTNPQLENLMPAPSSTVPQSIDLYCMDGENRYTVRLYSFSEDPTDDWLLSLGITSFADS